MNENTEIRNTENVSIISKLTNVDFLKSLIKPGIALIVSLLLLIMAFCPIIKYEQVNVYKDYEFYGDDDPDIEVFKTSMGISAAKYIGLFFDTLQSKSDKELKKSDLYDEMEDLEEEAWDEMEDLDDDENSTKAIEKLQLKYLYLTYRLSLQSKGISVNLVDILTLIFSIAYIVLAIALFALALLEILYKVLGDMLPIKAFCGKSKLMTTIICVLPAIVLLLYVLLFFGKSINSMALFSGTYYPVSIAGCAVFTLILSFACIIASMVLRVKAGEFALDKVARRRIVSAILAVIILCSICAPMFKLKLDGDFTYSGKNEKAGIKLDMFALSMYLEDYSDFFKDVIGYGGGISSGNLGGSNLTDEELEMTAPIALLAKYHDEEILSFNVVCFILYILVAVAAAAVLAVDTCNLATGACLKNRLVLPRTLSHIAIIVMTFFLVTFSFVFNEEFDEDVVTLSYAMNGIIMYFCTIFTLAYRPRKVKKAKKNVEE